MMPENMLNDEVGFFIGETWRFGPLYVFIPIAAQALVLGVPFLIEREGGGEELFLYNTEQVSGDEFVSKEIISTMKLLRDDFIDLVSLLSAK